MTSLLVHIEGEIADKYNYEDIMKEFKDAKSQKGWTAVLV
jgi:hypothetical protein